MLEHIQLHASQYKQKTQHPSHPLHKHITYFKTPIRLKHYIQQLPLHNTHSTAAPLARGKNKILCTPPPHISRIEDILRRLTRCTLAQLRTNKSTFLKSYLHKVDAKSHPSPLCSLCCNTHTHDTHTTHIISSTALTYAPR